MSAVNFDPELTEGAGQESATGVPETLRAGAETLSGVALDDVRVHYNSPRPAALGAWAYAQGSDIHIGPGQEQYLPHETWHVVQQKQGRVQPTVQAKGLPVNDDGGLEAEADSMGAQAQELGARLSSQPGAQGDAAPIQRASPASGPLQLARNAWGIGEQNAMEADATGLGLSGQTPQEQAESLLNSTSPVYWYGQTPATDEQVEITAGANYLGERKRNWQQELQNRQDPSYMDTGPTEPWEKFQSEIADLTAGEPTNPPWFLNPLYGYQVSTPENMNFMGQAQQVLNNPDPEDPQQLLGATYDRDTGLSTNSQFGQDQVRQVTTFAALGGADGQILRLFNSLNMANATEELRVEVGGVDNTGGQFQVSGTVVATPHISNGGFMPGQEVEIEQEATGALTIYNVVPGGGRNQAGNVAAGAWIGRLETSIFYNAVTVAEDSLGIRFQTNGATTRNRGAPPDLDDNLMSEIATRYQGAGPDDPLSYENSLGPWRNRINLEDLGWDISVAQYRRLGGDAIFNEAAHPHRDPSQYSNEISPASQVDVTNPNWYYDSQEHNPDRFVGGRSNSTFLYLKAASMLFQQGKLTVAECLDVIAFVIADMVVSGEHSMPECMTTVVMAAENSPPWTNTDLNIPAPQQTLTTWLHLVDDGTEQRMYDNVKQALVDLLAGGNGDYKLIKVLVALGKALHNDMA